MNIFKKWIFNFLVLLGIGAILTSWFLPWWQCDIHAIKSIVYVHPWGIEHNLGYYLQYMKNTEVPAFLPPLLWTYLGIAIFSLCLSIFIKEKRIRLFGKYNFSIIALIIIFVGLSYVIMAAIAYFYLSYMVELNGMKLQSASALRIGVEGTVVISKLMIGYYLLYVAGIYIILIGVFRHLIIGIKK